MRIDALQQSPLAAPAAGGAADEHVTREAGRVSQRIASLCSPQEHKESGVPIDPVETAEQQQRHCTRADIPMNETQTSSCCDAEANQPASLQDFEKLGLLGTGGAAVVYLVRHRASRELFALKVQQISPSDLQNRQTQRAFKELQILKALQHPFIAQLHDAFQDGTNLCLVLEFYQGGNLNNVQSFCGGTFQEPQARFYAAELVLALEYVHTMGFVYRDLKPQNVLVQGDGHIRLTDFGVAQHGDHIGSSDVGYTDDRVRLRSGSFVGTMEYMAPEMVQHKTQSSDVDWWTLGCLLYEFLYGTPPFNSSPIRGECDSNQEQDPAALFKEILKCRVEFPTERCVSDDCKDLLRRLLEKDPTRRLGHRFGACEIKQHRFFQGTQWALVGNQPPPVTTGSSSCTQRFHPASLGNKALKELVKIEQVLLGKFDFDDWIWALDSVDQQGCGDSKSEPEDDVVVIISAAEKQLPPLSRSSSTISNPEDTCDEELDRVLIQVLDGGDTQCRECQAPDQRSCLQARYQRNELFCQQPQQSLRRASSFIDTVLRRSRQQGSVVSQSVSTVRASSLFRAQTTLKFVGEPGTSQSQSQAALLTKGKSAWAIFTDKAATFLD